MDQEVIEKAYEIIDENKMNPNYCQEKQAELKKGAKGGKKK